MSDTAILLQADLASTTNTTLYSVPTGKRAILNINLCNRTASDVTFRLSFVASGDVTNPPSNSSFLEYDSVLKSKGFSGSVFLRTGEILPAGTQIVVRTSAVGVSATVTGAIGN